MDNVLIRFIAGALYGRTGFVNEANFQRALANVTARGAAAESFLPHGNFYTQSPEAMGFLNAVGALAGDPSAAFRRYGNASGYVGGMAPAYAQASATPVADRFLQGAMVLSQPRFEEAPPGPAMDAPASQNSIDIDATDEPENEGTAAKPDTKKAKEKEPKAEEIRDELTEALANRGYSKDGDDAETKKIVDAVVAASGTAKKARETITALPAKDYWKPDGEIDTAKQATWARRFSHAYAERVLGLDREAAQAYAEDTAFERVAKQEGTPPQEVKDDYLALKPEKVVRDGTNIYDAYTITKQVEGSGPTAAAAGTETLAGNTKTLYLKDGQWFTHDGTAYSALAQKPTEKLTADGRLYFAKGDSRLRNDATDVQTLTTMLEAGAEEKKARLAAAAEAATRLQRERVEEIAGGLYEKVAVKANLPFKVEPIEGGKGHQLSMTIDQAHAETVHDKLKAANPTEMDALMKQLPAGVPVFFNGRRWDLRNSGTAGLIKEVAAEVPGHLQFPPLDLAHLKGKSDNEITAELRKKIDVAMLSRRHPTQITFEKIILPADNKITNERWRAIHEQVSKGFEGISINVPAVDGIQ